MQAGSRAERRLQKEVAKILEAELAGGKVAVTRAGRTVDVRPKHSKSTSYLSLETMTGPAGAAADDSPDPIAGRPELVLREEGLLDRLGKRLWLNKEVQTGHDEFDDRIYIESDATDEQVQRVLAADGTKRAVIELFSLGCYHVDINEAGERLVVIAAIPEDEKLSSWVERTVDTFVQLADSLPPFSGKPSRRRRLLSAAIVSLSALLLIGGLIAAVVGGSSYSPLDAGRSWWCVRTGLLAWLIVTPLIGLLVRGGATALRTFALAFFLLLIGVPSSVLGAGLLINGGLDPHPAVEQRTEVISKRTGGGERPSYWLTVRDWRGGGTIELPVKADLYQTAEPGRELVVITGAGRLGWQWLRELRLAQTP